MSQLESIASYWNLRAEGYSDTIHNEMKNGRADEYLQKLKCYAPEGTALKCLDIGCGPGLFSILLAREGFDVTSADYSPGMLAMAEANMREAGFQAKTVRTDAAKLPFADETFDYIVSRNLVWNLEHPEATYREWLRVLKKGGRIFVIDANHYLHYYDETYKKAYEKGRELSIASGKDHSNHPSMKGVDPTPINEIARELPLSKRLRPEWDMETFRRLGITKMKIETTPGWFRRDELNTELIGEFYVCAEK